MSDGWIKLHRKIQQSDMYRRLNAKQRDVLIQCLLLANHSGKEWEWKGKVFRAEPGQFVTSIESLLKVCAPDLTYQNARTALNKLKKWGFLTDESTKTGRLISIVNWGKYQLEDKQTNKQTNKQLTNSQQTANKQLTTNKNVKNVKNDKEDKRAELESFINTFNNFTGKKYKPRKALLNNFIECRENYSMDEIESALSNIRNFWASDPTPELLLRRKNRQGDPVDYIGVLLNMKGGKKVIDEFTRQALELSKRQKEVY